MNLTVIISSVGAMAAVALLMAVVIWIVARQFHVEVDPRVDEVFEMLPAANCGGCGSPGCKAFANRVVETSKTGSIEGLSCPVGGSEVMAKIASFLHIEITEKVPTLAVVRCNGSKINAPAKVTFDGPKSCAVAHSLFSGDSGCPFGCLGCGDCERACPFDAIYIDATTGLPVVVDAKCVSCGKCVKACPRHIIEIRPKGAEGKRVFVSCMNTEKGGVARKNCSVACIGCGKCAKVCPVTAITIEKNLAYIDAAKCTSCKACVPECPTKAILATF